MANYSLNEDAADTFEHQDLRVVLPKYQCKECGKAIKEEYAGTTEKCVGCVNGNNQTEGLERIHTMTIYLRDEDRNEQGIVGDVGEFSDMIYEAKSSNHTTTMSNILERGLGDIEDLPNPDLITFPPSGEERNTNHMHIISQDIESSDSKIVDATTKMEDYPSQKSVDNMEQRIENVNGKIGISKQNKQKIDVSV
jgi:predicted nucleic acid-binding Zn ribbon protein